MSYAGDHKGMGRRASASSTTLGHASSSRGAHRSTESHPVGMSSYSQSVASGSSQDKVVLALIKRLISKLPCYSGHTLSDIESDDAVKLIVESLIDLAKQALNIIVWKLSEELEKLAKQTDVGGPRSLDLLQSQVLLLKVMAVILAHRWDQHVTQPRNSPTPDTASPHDPISPAPSAASTSKTAVGSKRAGQVAHDYFSSLDDVPLLNEQCAKWLVTVLLLLLRQSSPQDAHDGPLSLDISASLFGYESTDRHPPVVSTPGSNERHTNGHAARASTPSSATHHRPRNTPSLTSISSAAAFSIPLPPCATKFEPTPQTLTASAFSLHGVINHCAGVIIYLLSASNWSVVFHRIRDKIRQLAHAGNNEETLDVIDLQLLQFCALDRVRLIHILQELSSLLVNMRKEAMGAVAIVLRKAIWNWINLFPREYNDLVSGRAKLDGAPERVFDIFLHGVDGDKRAIWPVLAALLSISLDRMKQLVVAPPRNGAGKSNKKEVQFAEMFMKHMNPSSKLIEVAMVCCVDLCRAAARSFPEIDNPFRSFAPDLAADLKSVLWKAVDQRPFFESSDDIDVALYSTALVAITRFAAEDEAIQLLAMCLEPERSEAVKLCAINACIILVNDGARYPWQPAPPSILTRFAGRIRQIYVACLMHRNEVDERGITRRAASKPTAKRFTMEPVTDRDLVGLAVLAAYRVDLNFILPSLRGVDIEEFVAITIRLLHPSVDPTLSACAARTFIIVSERLLDVKPGDPLYEPARALIRTAFPSSLASIAFRLLDAREDYRDQRTCMEMAHNLVQLYAVPVEDEQPDSWRFPPSRYSAFAIAELAFLVSLVSADIVVSSMAARGLRYIALAENMPHAPVNPNLPEEERTKRYPIYEQLGDTKIVTIGRVAHQKRIRKILRLQSTPSPLFMAAWQECYWRWFALKDAVIRRSIDGISPDGSVNGHPIGDRSMTAEAKLNQWQNLTLFLASFTPAGNNPAIDIFDVLPADQIPDRFRAPHDGDEMMKNFITSAVNFLIADSVHAREAAREALGNELSPRSFPVLFRRLNEVMETITQTAGDRDGELIPLDKEEACLVFFEQFLILLKLLVDRYDTPSDDMLGNLDLNRVLISVTKLINRFRERTALRIKVKFCNFCESALAHSDGFGLRKDDTVRSNLLDAIVDWIQPSLPMSKIDEYDDSLRRLQLETNVASLRTVVKLLERHPLHPVQASAGDDETHVVSRSFGRYQQVLLRAMKLTYPNGLRDDDHESNFSSYSKRKYQGDKENDVRELVITGLANLLAANTEVGMKHIFMLANDGDQTKRAIFCHVVTRVLSLGTKFDASHNPVLSIKRNRICELVKGYNMILVLGVCETCPPGEVDMVTPVVMNLFDSRASMLQLLKLLIEHEVKTAQTDASLFRSNCMRMRILCAFAKQHGYDYLRKIIKPLVDQMRSLPEDVSFELDPSRAPQEEVEANQKTLKMLTQAFLDIICASTSILPSMLREVCSYIAESVAGYWPESKYPALGAFIFLRFISPTIVAPESVDVDCPRENGAIRRGLMTIAKIIQNLANNVRFGKEVHMMCFNDFLEENIVRVMRFLTDINRYTPSSNEEELDQWVTGTFDESDAIVLHRFFEKHADKIGKELLSLSKPTREGEVAAVGGKKAWDSLCAAIVDMGAATSVPRLSPLSSAELSDYSEFMDRHGGRNTEAVQDIFYDVTITRDETAIFCLAVCKFDVEILDFELLLYHAFNLLMNPAFENKNFEVIVDCTGFTNASELPIQWFKFAIEHVPSDLRARFRGLHILNSNWLTLRYLRKLYNVCGGLLLTSDIKPYTSVKDVAERLSWDVVSALENTYSLEEEPRETFPDVTMRQAHSTKMPVVVEVAVSHLRVRSAKPQNVFPTLSCHSVEIIPFADIGDIYNISTGRDSNEFIIRRGRSGGTLYFSSDERDHIVKTVRAAKSQVRGNRFLFSERFSRLSNVSARLLLIGVLNISCDDDELRCAAYDLLAAVSQTLNKDGTSLVPSKAGFIPGHPSAFVVTLSERVAMMAPRLTLDFLSEACAGLEKSNLTQRLSSLQYLSAWVRNLPKFANPASDLFEPSGARLRDCVRALIDLTLRDQEAYALTQRYIWTEIGRLDSLTVNIVLDELMRAAVDGGIGSKRCESIAATMVSLSSINVRGRILAKLRKTLGKISTKHSRSLTDNPHWTEIATYTRLALVTSYHSRHAIHGQLFVPEVVHMVTLLAGLGETVVRVTIYGLVMNLLHSLYAARPEDSAASDIRGLLDELAHPDGLKMFGLQKSSASSEYSRLDPLNDGKLMEQLEKCTKFMLRALQISAGNPGLANVWRARWMSLLCATAFQHSPSLQPRAFIVMGAVAASDVDDDLLYQMLVALKSAMSASEENDTMCVVSMLRCICNVVPSLPEQSRYLAQVFWLAVALLQSSHVHFYREANSLLCAALTSLRTQGAFKERGFITTLLEARESLEDVSLQLDQLLGISFESDFSFSLASVIFKGMRRPHLMESATEALRCLMTTALAVSTPPDQPEASTGSDIIKRDVLGYFLALLPVSTTSGTFQQLLTDAGVKVRWSSRKDMYDVADDGQQVPRVDLNLLGCTDQNTALLITSFVGAMLSTAQGDDAESQMLYSILADASDSYPEYISLIYESLQERINDSVANSTNSSILSSVSTIFRVAMEDSGRELNVKGSQSSLVTDENPKYGPGQRHIRALNELSMQGLANAFQFLPMNRGHANKLLNWFPELIARIIE